MALPFTAFPTLAYDGPVATDEMPADASSGEHDKHLLSLGIGKRDGHWHGWQGKGWGWNWQDKSNNGDMSNGVVPPSAGDSVSFTAMKSIPEGSYLTFVSGLNVISVKGDVKGAFQHPDQGIFAWCVQTADILSCRQDDLCRDPSNDRRPDVCLFDSPERNHDSGRCYPGRARDLGSQARAADDRLLGAVKQSDPAAECSRKGSRLCPGGSCGRNSLIRISYILHQNACSIELVVRSHWFAQRMNPP